MKVLDDIDRKILGQLQTDSRIPIQELAARVGLSPSPCHRRVKMLEAAGIITRYIAMVDQRAVGLPVSVFISIKLDRQKEEVERAAHYENLPLPADLDYMQVAALSFEVRQKLQTHRPQTLGQASRISGVTPAAVSLLLVHLKKGHFKDMPRRAAA